ncbi:MAG: 2-octaprenyl-6-methoxyphenyl hydroxylase [Gammaproteobacteria bacterium]
MNKALEFDCLIVGGGLVGASLACALGGEALRVAVLEAAPGSAAVPPSYDDRGLALSPPSQRVLQGLGLWEQLLAESTPILLIHVTERRRFAFARLQAAELGVEALGYVVAARALGQVLLQRLGQFDNVQLLRPAKPSRIERQTNRIDISINQGLHGVRTLSARLLIAADGGDSQTRALLGIQSRSHDYQQTAVVATASPERPHRCTAYERFTPNGPIALLPMTQQRCVAVWTVGTERAQALLRLNDSTYQEALLEHSGGYLGGFQRVGSRRAYPLQLIQAQRVVGLRAAVVGNAAQTLHPNAAQGLNLGLRDVATLAELVVDAFRQGKDIGDPQLLKTYAELRREDQRRVVRLSDGLARLFYNEFLPAILLRDAAMLAVDLLPPLKSALARRAMGLAGRQPRLVCGLSL